MSVQTSSHGNKHTAKKNIKLKKPDNWPNPLVLIAMGHDAITSDEHEKGYAAYHNRQYTIVLQEFKPLAEAGSAAAQNILGCLSGTGVAFQKIIRKQ